MATKCTSYHSSFFFVLSLILFQRNIWNVDLIQWTVEGIIIVHKYIENVFKNPQCS